MTAILSSGNPGNRVLADVRVTPSLVIQPLGFRRRNRALKLRGGGCFYESILPTAHSQAIGGTRTELLIEIETTAAEGLESITIMSFTLAAKLEDGREQLVKKAETCEGCDWTNDELDDDKNGISDRNIDNDEIQAATLLVAATCDPSRSGSEGSSLLCGEAVRGFLGEYQEAIAGVD